MKSLLVFSTITTFCILLLFVVEIQTDRTEASNFTLKGNNFNDSLPITSTCEGLGQSPALFWAGAPKETQSYAITMHRDLLNGNEEVCLVQYQIDGQVTELKTNNQEGVFGVNSIDDLASYAAPCSMGKKNKHYTITIYALSKAPALRTTNTTVNKAELELAILNITLAKASKKVILQVQENFVKA